MQLSLTRLLPLLQFELVRLFLTRRGLVGLLTFSLVWLLLLRYPIHEAVSWMAQPDFANMMVVLTGSAGVKKLLAWPESELALYWVMSLYIFPLFVVAVANDQTVEDRMRGTLRFISLRATRLEILLGRFFGQLAILSVLILMTLLATLIMMAFRDPSLMVPALERGVMIGAVLIATCAPFIALMSLLNCTARSARMAVVQAVLLFTLGELLLSVIAWKLPFLSPIKYLLPGVQVNAVALQSAGLMTTLAWPLIHSALILALAYLIMRRKPL